MKKYASYSVGKKFVFYLNFIAPISYVLSYLSGNEGLKIGSILFICTIRLLLLRPLVQCYLFAVLHHLEGLTSERVQKVLTDCLKLVYIPILKLISFPLLLFTVFMCSLIFDRLGEALNALTFWLCLFCFIANLIGIYKFKSL
jgi:hypothetical protein